MVSVASRGEGWSCGGVCGILRRMECIIIVGRGWEGCVCALCEMVWGLIEFGSWHGWVV